MTAQVLLAQTPMKPTAPGTLGDPAWQGIMRLSDGRTFVTDGGLAIDAALAKPTKLPERELPSKLLVEYLSASHKEECGLGELSGATSGKTYTTPSGIALNATYVNYLRRILSVNAVRLRMTAINQPVLVFLDGKAIAVLMPVRQ